MDAASEREEFSSAEKLYGDERYQEAFSKYKNLAERGSVESQVFVGWMYQQGLGVPQDYAKASEWYEKAAKLGSADAQFYLAKLYARKKDYAQAIHWYEAAAAKEYPPALYRLGWVYEVGRGVEPDREKAYAYYERAAKAGHLFAQKELALLLVQGQRGWLARLKGLYALLKTLTIGVWKASKEDPHSVRIRE